jgi:hypothetical protein
MGSYIKAALVRSKKSGQLITGRNLSSDTEELRHPTIRDVESVAFDGY